MNTQLKLSDDIQIGGSNPIKKEISNEPMRYSKFKSLKSLPNAFNLNKKPAKVNAIIEADSSLCDIPLINTFTQRNSVHGTGDLAKIKYEKSITALPIKGFNTNVNNGIQTQQTARSFNNQISYKERQLIRQSTINTTNTQIPSLKDNEYQDSYNQTTQFKSFQTGYITTNSLDDYQSTIPPLQTNLDLLTESNEESQLSETEIKERKKEKRKNLLKLMKTNPYQSLKHNVFYNFRKNQLTFSKYLSNKPVLNSTKTKEEGALVKVIKLSTLYIKSKPNRPHIILRLLARRNEMPLEFKNAIFWKGIQWLWKNYFVQIEKLLVSFQYYKWFLEKEKLITFKTVEEFFLLIQLKKYRDFCEALFLIFEEGNNKRINLKFTLTVLITTNKIPYKEQMKETLEVWESGRSGRIYFKEINEIIKNLFSNNKDIKEILGTIKNTFDIQDWNQETVDKSDLLTLFLTDRKIPFLIKRNKVDIDEIDQIFKDEILNLFNLNMRNSKMSLETHDAQKLCENDINRYEQVLSTLARKETEKEKRRVARDNNGSGDLSDD